MSVCLSVSHTLGISSKRLQNISSCSQRCTVDHPTKGTSFWTLSQTLNLENFATASRSCCQQNLSTLELVGQSYDAPGALADALTARIAHVTSVDRNVLRATVGCRHPSISPATSTFASTVLTILTPFNCTRWSKYWPDAVSHGCHTSTRRYTWRCDHERGRGLSRPCRNMFFLAATLVGWIKDFVYIKVAAKNIFL